MAKSKNNHYVKHTKKSYLTKRDIKFLVIILAVLIAAVILPLCIKALTDKSLDIKDGKLVDIGDNWIIANAGTVDSPRYYKYAEYNFEGIDAEVVVGTPNFDALGTCVELFPDDASYESAYIYATDRSPDAVIKSVETQMSSLITDGEVHPSEEFEGGYVYWYTTRVDSETEDGEPASVYRQIFSGYLPAENNGTLVIRISYEFDDTESYVEPAVAKAEFSEILKYITVE